MTTWLLTTTFYGQWLPGDERGSIAWVRDRRPGDPKSHQRIVHNRRGEAYEGSIPALQRSSAERLRGAPVAVDLAKAEALAEQFMETASYRGWTLHALSIMFNHLHMIVAAPTEVGKRKLLQDFKAYGARCLNERFGRPTSGTWWTDGGSCRPIAEMPCAIYYVCFRQPAPLLVWHRQLGRIRFAESRVGNRFVDE